VKIARLALLAAVILFPSAAFADDLTGHDQILCAAGTVTACSEDGECVKGAPFDFNVPQFVEVDLEAKTLSTTEASPERRSTPIAHMKRADGFIVLQGEEGGRAFSFMINEPAGLATVAVALDGFNIAVFGSCTPMPASN